MDADWLTIGIWRLRGYADCGELWATAVLDELARLRNLEHGTQHTDTDTAFVDVAQYVTPHHIVEFMQGSGVLLPNAVDNIVSNPPYTQTTTFEVLR